MLSTSDTLSHPTQSAPHLPQEIIDNIIDELSSDKATLEHCSIVSRSFYVSSRRRLFASIKIDAPRKAVLLHRLLIRTPDIAWLVHELMVDNNLPRWYASRAGMTEEDVWLDISKAIADVIAALPQIKRFSWHGHVDWVLLSSELQSALAKLFQNLIDISILYLDGFPLHIVSPVKRIWFSSVGLENSGQRQVTLPHLELLNIRDGLHPRGVQLLAPNLQRLVLNGAIPLSFMQQVINSSGRSLVRLWLLHESQPCESLLIMTSLCLDTPASE